jgi:hypothetical protein
LPQGASPCEDRAVDRDWLPLMQPRRERGQTPGISESTAEVSRMATPGVDVTTSVTTFLVSAPATSGSVSRSCRTGEE